MSSKIASFLVDKDVPQPVNKLLQEFVDDYNGQESTAWVNEVKNHDSDYHRRILLKQGRCNFDSPTHSLTSDELICLYNYYYFPMHFQSSYWLYNQLWTQGFGKAFISNMSPIFIDYGCGTLSSTIAFSSVYTEKFTQYLINGNCLFSETFNNCDDKVEHREFEQNFYKYDFDVENDCFIETKTNKWLLKPEINLSRDNIGYIFIDSSGNVLKHSIKYHSSFDFPYIDYDLWTQYPASDGHFHHAIVADNFFTVQYDRLNIDFIRDSIIKHNVSQYSQKGISIIINFSYLMASPTLDIHTLSELVKNIIIQFANVPICIINQNPDKDYLNSNWEIFKSKIPMKSILSDTAPIKHYGGSTVRYEILYKSRLDPVFLEL